MKKEPFQFYRYIAEKIYLIVFIVIVGAGLIVGVLNLISILTKNANNVSPQSNSSITIFDQTTIDKLNSFYKSSENSSNITSTTRQNPFAE